MSSNNYYVLGCTTLNASLSALLMSDTLKSFEASQKRTGDIVEHLEHKFGELERHVHYTFLFRLPLDDVVTIATVVRHLTLSLTTPTETMEIGIVSGTVDSFIPGCIALCSKTHSITVRRFFNFIFDTFIKAGFNFPFKRVDLGDQTYGLKI